MTELVEAALAGERRAIARLMSLLEEDSSEARRLVGELYRHAGQAHVVGITGAPGSGKSSLVAQTVVEYRRRGMTVGVLAVDPSSPFTGGSLLGDRVRMRALAGDPGVFVRSMATRGSLGGLARGTGRLLMVLDACGYDRIVVETVGAGQSEVDIARAAHTTVVLQVPGMGDDVQAMKAGILEIADILVVNKADLPSADQVAALLRAMLALGTPSTGEGHESWAPPILKTIATSGDGVGMLVDTIEQHASYLDRTGERTALDRRRLTDEFQGILREELLRAFQQRIDPGLYSKVLEGISERTVDPYAAAQELLREALG